MATAASDKEMREILNGPKYSDKEVSEKFGIALGTLRRWRYDKDQPGPRWIKIGGAIKYPEAWLIAYLSGREAKAG